ATKTAIRILGRRVLAFDAELVAIDALLKPLVVATAPCLLEVHGVGVDTAAILLVAAGDNPDRLRSEAAWAHLCGTAPDPRLVGQGHPLAAQPRRRPPSRLIPSANVARKLDPQLAAVYYTQMVERGGHHTKAVAVVAARLAERAWTVMARG